MEPDSDGFEDWVRGTISEMGMSEEQQQITLGKMEEWKASKGHENG